MRMRVIRVWLQVSAICALGAITGVTALAGGPGPVPWEPSTLWSIGHFGKSQVLADGAGQTPWEPPSGTRTTCTV